MTADLGELEDSARLWRQMGNRFGELKADYNGHVSGPLTSGLWTGLAMNSYAGSAPVTAGQFDAAKTEALAIASILTESHSQLTELQTALKNQVNGAHDAGYKVDDQGQVTYDYARLDPATRNAIHHDPDFQQQVSQRRGEWQTAIDKAVRAIDDADQGCKLALSSASHGDSVNGAYGFNKDANGDIEVAEGQRAAELGKKLEDGKQLSSAEMAELQRLFRDNSDDKAFSRQLLTDIGGADDLIKLTNKLNHEMVYGYGKDHPEDLAAVEKGLAQSLATATSGPHDKFYDDWVDAMKENGRHNFGSNTDPIYGYQTLTGLMLEGGKYDSDLLQTLGNDIIAYEKDKNPALWTGWNALPGTPHDPLNSILGVMGNNPEAATEFLDPQNNDHLKYLIKDREWPGLVMNGGYGPPIEMDDPSMYVGLGDALEAATMDVPGSDMAAHDRVLNGALERLSDKGDDFPPALRQPMATALTNQAGDVYDTMGTIGRGDDVYKEDQLFEVTKQIMRDPNAMTSLNTGLIPEMVDDIQHDTSGQDAESLLRSGRTLGVLEQAQNQAIKLENPDAELPAWKTAIDMGIGHIPHVGGDIQAGVDLVADEWLKGEQERIDKIEAGDYQEGYQNRLTQSEALADLWAQNHTDHPTHSEADLSRLNEAASAGYSDSRIYSGADAG
ncbi:DUF6571 family protein [Streptomyces smaragdinus]|nr:DUF6571 family protein [Streptomyces smaragdinus]